VSRELVTKRWRFIVDISKAAESGQLAKLARHHELPERTGGWSGLLIVLATRANADGSNAYPSSEWLGKVAGMRRHTVAEVLRDAVKMGLVETNGKHRRATIYNLLDVPAALAVLDAPSVQAAPQPEPQPEPVRQVRQTSTMQPEREERATFETLLAEAAQRRAEYAARDREALASMSEVPKPGFEDHPPLGAAS
jgi:hypothetical protein